MMDARHLEVMRRMLRKLMPGLPDGEPVSEDDLVRLAFMDPMTDLPNRRWIIDYMRQIRAFGAQGAVVLVDVDHFSEINARYGHPAGDEVLRECGRRLQRLQPPGSAIARVGGDEFLLVITDTDPHQAAELLKGWQDRMRAPIRISTGEQVAVMISAGITGLSGLPLDDVLRTADAAMYAAKERGRGRGVVFDGNLAGLVNRRRELASAVALLQQQNSQLRAENRTDALTGLLNRRALDEVLDRNFQGVDSMGVAAVFADIDHFGQINHLHGDDRGDEVLQAVAASMRGLIRAEDLLFRKGGEEFVALLFDISPEAARRWAERMRIAIQELGIPNAGSSTAPVLTLTLGVAHGPVGVPLRQLVRAAALQTMTAKVAGQRNRVHLAPVATAPAPEPATLTENKARPAAPPLAI